MAGLPACPDPAPFRRAQRSLGSWCVFAALALGLVTQAPAVESPPPAPTGFGERAVATENREASREAMNVLRAGGTAADAAVVAALVAGVAQPSSSGLGGGGFLLAWDAATKKPFVIDFRETGAAGARGRGVRKAALCSRGARPRGGGAGRAARALRAPSSRRKIALGGPRGSRRARGAARVFGGAAPELDARLDRGQARRPAGFFGALLSRRQACARRCAHREPSAGGDPGAYRGRGSRCVLSR